MEAPVGHLAVSGRRVAFPGVVRNYYQSSSVSPALPLLLPKEERGSGPPCCLVERKEGHPGQTEAWPAPLPASSEGGGEPACRWRCCGGGRASPQHTRPRETCAELALKGTMVLLRETALHTPLLWEPLTAFK